MASRSTARDRARFLAACAGLAAAAHAYAYTTGIDFTRITWKDRRGTEQTLKGVKWEWYDSDANDPFDGGDDYLFGQNTDANGHVGVYTSHWDTSDSNLEFYGLAYARIPGAVNICTAGITGSTYTKRIPTGNGVYIVPLNGDMTFSPSNVINNSDDAGTAIGMTQLFGFAHDYYVDRLGLAPSEITVEYDATHNGAALYQPGLTYNTINVGLDYWASWDVLSHEYAHHVQAQYGLANSPGGSHYIVVDAIKGCAATPTSPAQPARGADAGSRLAWGEGSATFLGQISQYIGDIRSAYPDLHPRDGDTWYDDIKTFSSTAFNADTTFRHDMETLGFQVGAGPVTSNSGRGEGNELSVMRALWDFADQNADTFTLPGRSDRAWMGDQLSFSQLVRGPGNTRNARFSDAWVDLTAYIDTQANRDYITLTGMNKPQAAAALGETLEEHSIASEPITGRLGTQVFLTYRPTIEFWEQNNDNSSVFEILLFDLNWQFVVQSFVINDTTEEAGPGDIPRERLAYTWNSDLPAGFYNYVVLSNPAGLNPGADDWYSWYWSGSRQFRVVPAPGVAAALAVGLLALSRRRRVER